MVRQGKFLRASTVRTWYRVHKWASLICTAFLLMSCVTGLPLIFSNELQTLLEPDVAPSLAHSGTPPPSIDTLVAETQAKFPSLHPYNVYWDDDAPRIFVNMSPSDNPKDSEFKQAIFDANTGKLLEIPKGGFNLVEFLLELHSEMFLGLTGELVLGVMALSFVLSLISGVLVYGPFMRRLRFGTYRAGAASKTRWFDLHNLLGIVILVWALVVGITGAMNAISTPLFGLWRAQTMPQILAPYRGKPEPTNLGSIDAAVEKAALTLPDKRVSAVLFPNKVFGSPRHYVIWSNGKTPLTALLFTPALVDVQNGALTVPKGLPWYLRALEVSRPLHFGNYGGLPLKILWALFDLALIGVLVSGLYLWLLRRRAPIEQELNRLVSLEVNESEVPAQ